jgi:hypothetical protein
MAMEFEGERLKVFACPLGGVGSGNVSFSGTGQLVAWQIVNNFNSGAHGVDGAIVPLTFFACLGETRANLKSDAVANGFCGKFADRKRLEGSKPFPNFACPLRNRFARECGT